MTTITTIIVDALRTLGNSQDFKVGDGIARVDNVELAPPYIVVYKIFTSREGPMTNRNADPTERVQLNSVAFSRWGAEDLAEQAAAVILGALPNPTGLVFAGQPARMSNGISRDDATNSPRFMAVDQYYLPLTPA